MSAASYGQSARLAALWRDIDTAMPWWYVPAWIGYDAVVGAYILIRFLWKSGRHPLWTYCGMREASMALVAGGGAATQDELHPPRSDSGAPGRFRPAAAVAAGLVLAVAVPGVSHAAAYYELRYQGAMSSPTVVTDSSGNANHGLVTTANGGSVQATTDAGSTNPFLRFPSGTCATAPCPQAIVTPTSSANLVPNGGGAGPFAFGASIRLTATPSTTAGMNVFQRGLATAGASQWKLQTDYGYPSCRWSDGTNVVLLPGSGDPKFKFALNTWNKVKCSRLANNVFEIRITDPATGALVTPVLSRTAALGAVAPTGNATVGAKKVNASQVDSQTDQFHGDLDDIFFHRD